jgi:hypothetical protein
MLKANRSLLLAALTGALAMSPPLAGRAPVIGCDPNPFRRGAWLRERRRAKRRQVRLSRQINRARAA